MGISSVPPIHHMSVELTGIFEQPLLRLYASPRYPLVHLHIIDEPLSLHNVLSPHGYTHVRSPIVRLQCDTCNGLEKLVVNDGACVEIVLELSLVVFGVVVVEAALELLVEPSAKSWKKVRSS